MLVVITTDADVSDIQLDHVLGRAVDLTFNRIDSDGCMSTNDTVLVLSSGASGVKPSEIEFSTALTEVCASLARQLIAEDRKSTRLNSSH